MYYEYEIIKYHVHYIQWLLVEQVHQNIRCKSDDGDYINQLQELENVLSDDRDFFLNYKHQFLFLDDVRQILSIYETGFVFLVIRRI
jgi:hypothetical protein